MAQAKPVIRAAATDDLPAIVAIYNHYIVNDHATFDTEPFTAAEKQPWFDTLKPGSIHQCLVAEHDGKTTGYCYSAPLRPKPAYATSVETTIYLHPDAIGAGIGRQLYSALVENLSRHRSLHRAYGVIAQPNEPSNALHESLGYRRVGVLSEVGFKFGRYWDTAYYQLDWQR